MSAAQAYSRMLAEGELKSLRAGDARVIGRAEQERRENWKRLLTSINQLDPDLLCFAVDDTTPRYEANCPPNDFTSETSEFVVRFWPMSVGYFAFRLVREESTWKIRQWNPNAGGAPNAFAVDLDYLEQKYTHGWNSKPRFLNVALFATPQEAIYAIASHRRTGSIEQVEPPKAVVPRHIVPGVGADRALDPGFPMRPLDDYSSITLGGASTLIDHSTGLPLVHREAYLNSSLNSTSAGPVSEVVEPEHARATTPDLDREHAPMEMNVASSPNEYLIRRGSRHFRLTSCLGTTSKMQRWLSKDSEDSAFHVTICREQTLDRVDARLRALNVLSALGCPNCIDVVDFWEASIGDSGREPLPPGNNVVIVTPYYRKPFLPWWRRRASGLDESTASRELLRLLRPVAESLDALNARGISHANVTWDWLRLKDNGEVLIDDASNCTPWESHVGSLRGGDSALSGLASPEQLCGYALRQTDQYGFALSYYFLRTGQLPFDRPWLTPSLMWATANGLLRFERVSKSEEVVLRRAMATEATERFASIVEFVERVATSLG